MDPEQTFLRVHARLSGVLARLLTPRFRAMLEYLCLFNALSLLALLVVMHVNFVAQPGCSEEFSGRVVRDAQLVQIKITGSWNHITGKAPIAQTKQFENVEDSDLQKFSENTQNLVSLEENSEDKISAEGGARPLAGPGKGVVGTLLLHYVGRWSSYVAVCVKSIEQTLRSFWQVWRSTGWEPFAASPKGDRRSVAWSKLDSFLVGIPDKRKVLDPTYLYSLEKGYLILSDGAKSQHSVRTVNVTLSAQNSCFGNRWQQLVIDNFVGYDTILMNSLLHARGKGYLYNFQTKELYNLNYLQDFGEVPHGFEDYIVFKCGVLITSLFVFFTTTMSVSFTLRETQARMLKFTVQLQHHARHRLPTYRLIFVHVVESLVFVPIMIGILFFLFEFFDDQLLAFMVLTLVWLCELYTMISVRTALSMQYFPRFFFLYFMVFHVYFFSYTYGFSYLAFSATGAFMQHLVLYFWNQFEVPALQNFLQRRALFQQQRLQISSAILQVTRFSNSSLVGDNHDISLNFTSHRGGNPLSETVNTESGGSHVSRPLRTLLERDGGSDQSGSQPSVYPLSIGNLHSFTLDGSAHMYDASGRNSNTGLSSLIHIPPDGQHDRLGSGVNIRGWSEYGEGESERDRIRQTRGMNFEASGLEAQMSRGETTHLGTFSSLGSVLLWIFGSSAGNLVSILPIFRDVRDGRRQLDLANAVEEVNYERGLLSGASRQAERESNQRTLLRGAHSPTMFRRRSNLTQA